MTAIPAAGFPSNAGRTQGQIKTVVENFSSLFRELLGGTAGVAVTLDTGSFETVNNAAIYIADTQSAATLDQLTNIDCSNLRDGQFIGIRLADSTHQILIEDAATGAGQILLADSIDFLLENTEDFIILQYYAAGDGLLREVMRSSALRMSRLPGSQEAKNLAIVSDTLTPTQFHHRVDPAGGGASDSVIEIIWLYPNINLALFSLKDSSETVTWKNNDGAAANKLFLRGGVDLVMNDTDQYLLVEKFGDDAQEVARFGFDDSVLPIASGGRLTVSSTLPVPGDLTSQGTAYLLPYGPDGNRISIYDGSKWGVKTFTNPSENFPNYSFCPWLAFAYDNNGAVDIEFQHNGASQVTKTISGATAAASCVITTSTSHGLSVGDLVAITGIVGTMGTDSKIGLNSTATSTRLFKVTATPTGTTFTLGGITTTGKTYTSGGTVYVVGSIPTFSYQDGVPVKTGDATRRLIGAGVTGFTAGQCHSTGDERFVASRLNPVNKAGAPSVMSNSHTYNSTTPRLMDLDITKRKQWVSIHPDLKSYARLRGTGVNGASSIAFWNLSWDSVDNSGADSGLNAYGNASLNGGNTFTTLEDQVLGAGVGIHSVCVNESCTAASNSTFVSNEVQATVWW